jgi:hypothetical protein
MISMRLTFLTLIACVGSSLAGEIYGTIKENGKPVEKGIPVLITLAADRVVNQTDEFGGYRIFVPQVGPCRMDIFFKGKPISYPIQSYTKPIRLDLVLENTNGTYTLKRE